MKYRCCQDTLSSRQHCSKPCCYSSAGREMYLVGVCRHMACRLELMKTWCVQILDNKLPTGDKY